MSRPATQNRKDAERAKKLLDSAYDSIAKAWNLIHEIEKREIEQHASTGRTDASQARRVRREHGKH